MSKFTFMLVFVLGLAPSLNAGQFGEAHNRYLACLRGALPQGQVSAREVLNTLVNSCRYAPPAANARDFVETYSPLLESTLRNVQAGGLSAVVSSYRERFTDTHISYLNQVEDIVKNQNPREAVAALDRLHAEATRRFQGAPGTPRRGNQNADVAVLAAIDIASSSTQYWERAMPRNEIRMMVKWWQVVLADVAGGVVGGVFGAGVGAVGLGTACSAAVSNI